MSSPFTLAVCAEMVYVAPGLDEADRWIEAQVSPGDVVVTGDIPLAARAVEAGAAIGYCLSRIQGWRPSMRV